MSISNSQVLQSGRYLATVLWSLTYPLPAMSSESVPAIIDTHSTCQSKL